MNKIMWGVADFETSVGVRKTKVYLWCFVYEQDNNKYKLIGYNIQSFLNTIILLVKKNKESITIYFHNLKFDGEFIFWHLIKNFELDNIKFLKTPQSGFFWIKLFILKTVKRQYIIFKDSYKVLPLSVFELTINENRKKRKQEYDYDAVKPLNYRAKNIDKQLCEDDCLTVFEHLQSFKTCPTTISSYSYSQFKKSNDYCKWDFIGNHEYLRNWYRGGFVKVWNDNLCEDVSYLDINSLYPYIMLNMRLPYGNDWSEVPTNSYNYGFFEVYITHAKIIGENKPFIPSLNSVIAEYNNELNEGVYYLSQPEFNLFKLTYSGVWYIKKVYYYKSKKDIFLNYLSPLKILKESTQNIIIRTKAKLLQNSLYGKFGQRINLQKHVLQKCCCKKRKNHITYKKNKEKYCLLLKDDEVISPFKKKYNSTYLPLAASITAEARIYLIKHLNILKDSVLYCDTDSVVVLNESKHLWEDWIDPKEYGKWKNEGYFNYFYGREAKAYWLKNNIDPSKDIVKCKGVNNKLLKNQLDWKSWISEISLKFTSLQSKKIDGGVIITRVEKTIK